MSYQTWQETLTQAQTDGTAVTGTAAASLLPPQAKFTLPAGILDVPGRTLRVRATGRISNIVTTPGTLAFLVKFGGTTVFAPAATSLNAVAKTNVTWQTEFSLALRTSGSSAVLMGVGYWSSESIIGSAANTQGSAGLPASAPVVGAAFDATVSQQVDLQAQFSLTGNSIQLHQYALELIN